MDWQDEGIVIGTRKHAETGAIVELLTRDHGRHLGLVQGGRSRTMRPLLQPGNTLHAHWRARLESHLGTMRLEAGNLRAGHLMESPHQIFALQTLASHIRLLAERERHTRIFEMLVLVLDNLTLPAIAGEMLVRFELAMLEELGFGLELSRCAATGQRDDLTYVSPKSGKAVSRGAGADYADRLLHLPGFLTHPLEGRSRGASLTEIETGLALAAHFYHRHVHGPRGIAPPAERDSFRAALRREIRNDNPAEPQ